MEDKKNIDINNPLAWLEYRNKNKNIDFTKEIIEDQEEDEEDLDEDEDENQEEKAPDDVS